ncbi:MAG: hypothetical protein ACRD1V_21700, partial [Vicinamibacterales bacterium]
EVGPPKVLMVAPGDRIATLPSAQAIPVRLDAAFLTAQCLALVPFPSDYLTGAGRGAERERP